MVQIGFEGAYAEFENTIASPALKQVAQHWRSICRPGQLPGWADLRPSAIKAHLPIVWSYDYDPGLDDFVGRLAGVEITGVSSKPFKGTRLSELRPDDKYPRSLIRARRVVQEPALYRGLGLVYRTGGNSGFGERIVMPLAAQGSHPAGIFGATEYKSLAEWLHSSSDVKGESESWFSLAGSVEAPEPREFSF
jgi:hypothetical protein